MNLADHASIDARLNEKLATSGFRFTPQRQHVYGVLLANRSHPTAEEVFIQSKQSMPDISMATVYNCLDALVKCGLIRQVNVERTATRYCPNMREHCHFYCSECGQVFDINLPAKTEVSGAEIPDGFRINHYEIAIHGVCPKCGQVKTS